MTYTVERVHACVFEPGRAVFRLTYEITHIPELDLWRHALVHQEKLRRVAADLAFLPEFAALQSSGAISPSQP